MTGGKDTCCSLCHGEVGPDIDGRVMCYGCGPIERIPPEQRKTIARERAPAEPFEPVPGLKTAAPSVGPSGPRPV